jgi:hypothetical protein
LRYPYNSERCQYEACDFQCQLSGYFCIPNYKYIDKKKIKKLRSQYPGKDIIAIGVDDMRNFEINLKKAMRVLDSEHVEEVTYELTSLENLWEYLSELPNSIYWFIYGLFYKEVSVYGQTKGKGAYINLKLIDPRVQAFTILFVDCFFETFSELVRSDKEFNLLFNDKQRTVFNPLYFKIARFSSIVIHNSTKNKDIY